jgi:hypothetical protein
VGFNNHTLRMNPRVSIGGDTLRVRVSNAYGHGKLAIGAAYVGIRDKGPAIVPGSERVLTFCGSGSATVAAGALVVSDSVKLDVKPLTDLAVTLYLPGEIPPGFQITGGRPITSLRRGILPPKSICRSARSSTNGSS